MFIQPWLVPRKGSASLSVAEDSVYKLSVVALCQVT